jgi:colicin import membrane protein
MRAVIQIRMLPTGELIDARITQSSGDPAFDRSAENAVYRAAPFSELTALPIRVFNQNFRTLSLIFQPEDLLN